MEIGLRLINLRTATAAVMLTACLALLAPQPAKAGVADNVYGWMWSGTLGWISMNCTNTSSCGSVDYGVKLVDVPGNLGWADMSGWGWSETLGWTCFGASCAGTTPEGGASYAQYRDLDGGRQDQVYGWAKIESMGDEGWISLNCENMGACIASNYHVVLDPLTGKFTKGTPTVPVFNDHWAWGGTDELTGAGWVSFEQVITTWTIASLGRVLRPEGVYEPDNVGLHGTHLTSMEVGFVNMSIPENYLLECDLNLPDGSKRVLQKVAPSTVREGYESLDYVLQPSDYIEEGKLWTLGSCRIGADLNSTICNSDGDCPVTDFCDETGGFCRLKLRERDRLWPVFTHENEWSGLDAGEDQYKALLCHLGLRGNYFNNAAVCDFGGDASFSLVMRRGVPIEGDCHDGIDNDGNGEIDCADRNCQGISYLCGFLPRAECVWGQPGDGLFDCSDLSYEKGDLCCSHQPKSPSTPGVYGIVNGLECEYGNPNDGYFDCDCTTIERFNQSSTDDCFFPGYQSGDLCCNSDSDVVKQ